MQFVVNEAKKKGLHRKLVFATPLRVIILVLSVISTVAGGVLFAANPLPSSGPIWGLALVLFVSGPILILAVWRVATTHVQQCKQETLALYNGVLFYEFHIWSIYSPTNSRNLFVIDLKNPALEIRLDEKKQALLFDGPMRAAYLDNAQGAEGRMTGLNLEYKDFDKFPFAIHTCFEPDLVSAIREYRTIEPGVWKTKYLH